MRSESAGDGSAVKIVAVKNYCVESAWRVVDLAMDVSGGRGMARDTELERLFRDTPRWG